MGDVLNSPRQDSPPNSPDSTKPEDKPGRRISWHQGEKFLDEFDDSHLWLHGKAGLRRGVEKYFGGG